MENNDDNIEVVAPVIKDKVGQEQIHSLLFGDKLTWHEIIYDLINTEQLDPWDIDLSVLTEKYLARVRLLEEANFFISSKVLLAASLLLRIKSEILLDQELPGLDAILFNRKDEEKKYVQNRITLDEEIPGLVAKTPLPRYKKVTLAELMNALNKAMVTENRRIKKIVIAKQQEFETSLFMPKSQINLKDRIVEVYSKLEEIFKNREESLAFSELAGKTNEERIATFIPLLHLDNQQKVWIEQEGHLAEIWILLKHIYEKKNHSLLEQMKKEVEEEMKKFNAELTPEQRNRADMVQNEFANPLGESMDNAMQESIDDDEKHAPKGFKEPSIKEVSEDDD